MQDELLHVPVEELPRRDAGGAVATREVLPPPGCLLGQLAVVERVIGDLRGEVAGEVVGEAEPATDAVGREVVLAGLRAAVRPRRVRATAVRLGRAWVGA